MLAIVAFLMRRDMHETEAFTRETRRNSSLKTLMEHPREVAIVVGLTMGGTVHFYTYSNYMQKFLVNTSRYPKDTATLISASALFIYMCLQPLVGHFSDKIGRRPVLMAFGVLGTLTTVPILTALETTRDPLEAFALVMTGLVIVSGYARHQRRCESRAFPDAYSGAGRGPALCRHRGPIRRYCRVYRPFVQETGARKLLLLVRYFLHLHVFIGVFEYAGYEAQQCT